MTPTSTPDATPTPATTPTTSTTGARGRSTAEVVGLLLADAAACAAQCPRVRPDSPPSDSAYAAALWLVHLHPTLARLLVRVPGVVGVDPDAREPGDYVLVDLDALATAVDDHDAHTSAWTGFTHRRPAPRGDDAYATWAATGPHPTRGAEALGRMSGTERTRLRLLAAFAPTTRTRITARDLTGLDTDGRALLSDWADALLTY